jgi:hypothetical protein
MDESIGTSTFDDVTVESEHNWDDLYDGPNSDDKARVDNLANLLDKVMSGELDLSDEKTFSELSDEELAFLIFYVFVLS